MYENSDLIDLSIHSFNNKTVMKLYTYFGENSIYIHWHQNSLPMYKKVFFFFYKIGLIHYL